MLSAQSSEQLLDLCIECLDDATYLADFQVELEAGGGGRPVPVARYSMVLNKNSQYRLTICNSENSRGRGIIQLYDSGGRVGSNHVEDSGGNYFSSFDVQINKTGVYHILISFEEGLPGQAVGILSFVKRL